MGRDQITNAGYQYTSRETMNMQLINYELDDKYIRNFIEKYINKKRDILQNIPNIALLVL